MNIYRLMLILVCLGSFLSNAGAATYYVNADQTTSGSGTSWATAFKTISEGITTAANAGGGEVWVAAGTYYVYSSSTNNTVQLQSNVDLYGGFKGTEASRDQRDWQANETILDGHASSGSQNQVNHVVTGADNAIIDGFTITGGNAAQNMAQPKSSNGAKQVYSPSLSIKATSPDAIFSSGGGGCGGGMLIFQNCPTINNCTFENNQALKGGAVYVMVSTEWPTTTPNPAPTFTNCVFDGNTASTRGAGISNDVASHPTFINCMITNNTCGAKGGGMYNDFGCSPTLINCLIAKNTALRASAMGIDGASNPKLVNCTVTDNYAYDLGAGLYTGSYLSEPNEPILINCIIWGNENQYGGPTDLAVWHENHFYVTNSALGRGFNSNGAGVIYQDPMFVDPDNGDYSLQADSPCVDTGSASDSDVPSDDLDGTARDSKPDMGAYERTASASTTGSLTVTLSPQAAIDAGAQWKVESGDWQNSGATVSGLNGTLTVSFKDTTGYTTPAIQTITITDGQTTSLTATYTATSSSNDSTDDDTGGSSDTDSSGASDSSGGGGCFISNLIGS